MRISSPGLFVLAVLALLGAHVLRAIRQSYLFPRSDAASRPHLLLALATGYSLNAFLPLRIGELIRTLLAAVRMRLAVSSVAATVAAERGADLIAAAVLLSVLAGSAADPVALIFLAVAAGLAAFAGGVALSPGFRRGIWRLSSLFNRSVQLEILNFAWSTSQLLWSGVLLTRRFLLATTLMWAAYLLAYALLARALGLSVEAIARVLLGLPFTPLLTDDRIGPDRQAIALFAALPIVLVLLVGLAHSYRPIARSIQFAWRFGLASAGASPSARDAFRSDTDFGAFLTAHFSNAEHIVSKFGMTGLEGAEVHRILPGGSDALTAVVKTEDRLVIRKFAIGDAAKKLEVQAQWLRLHQGVVTLPQVLSERREAARFRYDMPYHLSARDFYDVIHTSPIDTSRRILREVVDEMRALHAVDPCEAAWPVVDDYLERKASANAREILSFARLIVDRDYSVNGEPFRLTEWDVLCDPAWLRAQIKDRRTGTIHGDLTIENIIVCPEHPRGWYLIDPNPQNIFQSPLIDWAKLMQSLNLGYEGLNRQDSSSVEGSSIKLFQSRSTIYSELHQHLGEMLAIRLHPDAMREIAFHELINYLRLTPYKIRHNPERAVTFFACASLLLRRYLERSTSGDRKQRVAV